jgi:hypothetical protein
MLPVSNPLQEACSSFQVAACNSKSVVTEAARDSENCSESRLEKITKTNDSKKIRKREQKF